MYPLLTSPKLRKQFVNHQCALSLLSTRQETASYYFVLTVCNELYGANHDPSIDEIREFVMRTASEVHPYSDFQTEQDILSDYKSRPISQYYDKLTVVNLVSLKSGFDKKNFYISSSRMFKMNPIDEKLRVDIDSKSNFTLS